MSGRHLGGEAVTEAAPVDGACSVFSSFSGWMELGAGWSWGEDWSDSGSDENLG